MWIERERRQMRMHIDVGWIILKWILQKWGCVVENWIHLAQDSHQWMGRVNKVTNLRVP
jgi:hypothetical protein